MVAMLSAKKKSCAFPFSPFLMALGGGDDGRETIHRNSIRGQRFQQYKSCGAPRTTTELKNKRVQLACSYTRMLLDAHDSHSERFLSRSVLFLNELPSRDFGNHFFLASTPLFLSA